MEESEFLWLKNLEGSERILGLMIKESECLN